LFQPNYTAYTFDAISQTVKKLTDLFLITLGTHCGQFPSNAQLEQHQTLSPECTESVLTSNDLTENFLMSKEVLEELLLLDIIPSVSGFTTNNKAEKNPHLTAEVFIAPYIFRTYAYLYSFCPPKAYF
jgi:hypothetical protein